jgi:hypothetical protein
VGANRRCDTPDARKCQSKAGVSACRLLIVPKWTSSHQNEGADLQKLHRARSKFVMSMAWWFVSAPSPRPVPLNSELDDIIRNTKFEMRVRMELRSAISRSRSKLSEPEAGLARLVLPAFWTMIYEGLNWRAIKASRLRV